MALPFKILLYILGTLTLGVCVMFYDPSGSLLIVELIVAVVVGIILLRQSNSRQPERLYVHLPEKPLPNRPRDLSVEFSDEKKAPGIRVNTYMTYSYGDELDLDEESMNPAWEEIQRIEGAHFRELRRLNEINTLHPVAFERFVAALFKYRGYESELTKTSGDQGVDLFVRKEGTMGVVQCKRQKKTIGQPIVRDLYGTMLHNKADEAYLVTTGSFSAPALEWAKDKPIHLIDGKTLMRWAREFGTSQR